LIERNYSQITQFLQHLGWIKIESNLVKSIQIPGLDVEYVGHVSSPSGREKIEYMKRIKLKKCTTIRILAKLIGKYQSQSNGG
jgi:hypothetical protein